MILGRDELRGWATVRRYAVPAPMIARATGRRLAGDWRGACAAADVAVDLDLAGLARRYGAEAAAAVEEDLRHLAPDLLRWHLPRRPGSGFTALTPRRLSVLKRYAGKGPNLCVGSPRTGFGRQQLRLFVAEEPLGTDRPPAAYRGDRDHEPATWYQRVEPDLAAHQWDARAAGELPAWHGLAPGFDVGPLVYDLYDGEALGEAWGRHGVEVHLRALMGFWYRLPELARAVRRLAAESGAEGVEVGFADRPYLVFEVIPDGAGQLSLGHTSPYYPRKGYPFLRMEQFGVPLDAVLVHFGLVRAEELHPLVHAGLYGGGTAGRSTATPEPAAVRVRCHGAWHEVRMLDGRLAIPHDAGERQHEETLAALGGTTHGCFAVAAAWRDGDGRLPRRLRELRRELLLRALHGDADGVTALLDAGVDPRVRDHRYRSLLHFLPHLRDPALLDRLLAAGLDVDAPEAAGLTPLAVAVHGMGDVALIRALLAAGARPDRAVLESGELAFAWMAKTRPDDFAALGL